MKHLCREPLVHFLLLGAGLFVAFGLVDKRTNGEPGKIVITQGQIEHLAAGYNRVHGRPASPEELEGLIRDYVREEVYCREALALGLDRDDAVIRNRLRLKMEFISDDVAAQAEPTDEQLRGYLQEHPDAFGIEPHVTFSQVYLNPERHRQSLAHDAAQLLTRLNQAGDKADVSELGDPFLLEHTFVALTASEVAKQFGEKFAAKLGELPRDQWQGPVESGYGVHLVFVSETTEGRVPTLEEVRDAVRREWANARRLEANERFYQDLLKRYTVTIERSQPTKAGKKLAMEARR
jgi:PPIC-type PPIASE domain